MRRARRDRAGAAMIEFALGSVVFFIFLFGVMDWAWVFFQHQTIMWRTSGAARWIAANKFSQAAAQSLVLCGSPTCTGSYTGFFSGDKPSVVGTLLVKNDTVYDSPAPPLKRYFVEVRVSGYEVRQFTPWAGRTFTGAPIVAVQPMECEDPAGDCTKW